MQVGIEDIEIRNMRFGYASTRTAIVSLPKTIEDKVQEGNKIKLGFTYCLIKVALNVIRCFKCHEFGHMTYTCPNKQAPSLLCRKYGR